MTHLLPCTAVSCVLFLVCCVLCFLFYGVCFVLCSVCFVICVVFRILCCVSVTLPCELCASDSLCVAIPLQDRLLPLLSKIGSHYFQDRLPAPTIVPPAFQDSSASIISPAALPFPIMLSKTSKLCTEQVWAEKTPLEEYTLKIEVGKLLVTAFRKYNTQCLFRLYVYPRDLQL